MTKKCTIYATPLPGGRFAWQWRAEDGRTKSERAFSYFYDCLADAREHGFEVEVPVVVEQLRHRQARKAPDAGPDVV